MILIDTSYWLALAYRPDSNHVRARAWADSVDEPFLVTEYVLWETVNSLSSPRDRLRARDIATVAEGGDPYVFIPASRHLTDAGLALHRDRPDKYWSLTDCISFIVMNERRVTRALTHDQHFIQAGYEALLRRDP